MLRENQTINTMETIFRSYNRRLDATESDLRRYLYDRIDWDERLIGIKGMRGVGKTTMLLHRIKSEFPDRSKALYASLDNIWFSAHTLIELVEYAYTHGVTHIFLDEVHNYPNWIREMKNIYDDFPKLHVVFTGSSLLKVDNSLADLSRRLRMYTLNGLSFREYLAITGVANFPTASLEEILSDHVTLASKITSEITILPHFENYIKAGYYPFFNETNNVESYFEKLQNAINTVITNDIPAIETIEHETLRKTKRLLYLLAQMTPFTPNITRLCETLSTTRNQLMRLLAILERARLLCLLNTDGKNLKAIGKPEKILFDNPNLMAAISSSPDIGAMRESFVASMITNAHTISYPPAGDLLIDGKYTLEIGGKNKGFTQIRDTPESFVAADGIETGFGNKIPIWLFGFLY